MQDTRETNTHPRIAALLYHNVAECRPGTYSSLSVPPDVFRRQMAGLSRRGYTGISARDWYRACQENAPLPAKPVILTFDDGYSDLVDCALPVLQSNGFRATVFIVTDLVGGEDAWLRREGKSPQRLLTAHQIQHWASRGIEFGAHSRTHADLTRLSPGALALEVQGSGEALARIVGAPVTSFAYPYGFYTPPVVNAVRESFELAFTVEDGLNDCTTDRHLLHRTMVKPTDNAGDVIWRAAIGRHPVEFVRGKMGRTLRKLLP